MVSNLSLSTANHETRARLMGIGKISFRDVVTDAFQLIIRAHSIRGH